MHTHIYDTKVKKHLYCIAATGWLSVHWTLTQILGNQSNARRTYLLPRNPADTAILKAHVKWINN